MIEWYKKVVFENFANFSGRARRSEYWYFVLANIILLVAVVLLSAILVGIGVEIAADIFTGIGGLYMLAILVPWLAVIVRRLHDSNKSGWYFFIRFVPLIGGIWILVLLCTEGDHGENDYGVDPKIAYDEMDEIGVESGY